MKCYYDILNVKQSDTIEIIAKKYKGLAKKWHPDRHPKENKKKAEEKFKEISNAYLKIKQIHNNNRTFYGNIDENVDFKNFTDKLINKGKIIGDIINQAKNIDLKDFFNTFFVHIKKFRFLYDDMFSSDKTEDIIININVSLEDIYNKEDKIVNITRKRKCKKCYNNDLKFCKDCNNKIFLDEEKSFIFNCSDKIVIFTGDSNEEKDKKTGDLIFKIHPKPHTNFKIINNYDVYYEIQTKTQEDIKHTFVNLDKKNYNFKAEFPFRNNYTLENRGLPMPYSDNTGDLIIKIVYTPYDMNDSSKYSFNSI